MGNGEILLYIPILYDVIDEGIKMGVFRFNTGQGFHEG